MSQIINLPWLSRRLEVTDSTDPALVGISGIVVDETRRTIMIDTGSKEMTLAKTLSDSQSKTRRSTVHS